MSMKSICCTVYGTVQLIFLSSFIGFIGDAGAAQQEFQVSPNARVVVKLTEGKLNLEAMAGAGRGQLQYQDQGEEIKVQTENDEVLVQGTGRILRPSAEPLKLQNQKRTVDLKLPAGVVVEIHMIDGQVTLQRWRGATLVHLEKGKVSSRDGEGALIIHVNKGETMVVDHRGPVTVDNYNSQVVLRNIEGDLRLENFMGETSTEKTRGHFRVSQSRGAIHAVNHQGLLNLDLQRAIFNGQQLSGRLEGQSEEGSITAQLGSEAEVNLRSQSGKMVVILPADVPVQLNLATQEGEITLPSVLKVNRDSDGRSYRGRWRGESAKHFVTLKSQEGLLQVK